MSRGHPVHLNRVIAGLSSYGEKTSPKAPPPTVIRRIVPLKSLGSFEVRFG